MYCLNSSLLHIQGPVVTDNGGFLIDWCFDGDNSGKWDAINRQIKMIPGNTRFSYIGATPYSPFTPAIFMRELLHEFKSQKWVQNPFLNYPIHTIADEHTPT